jgi:hypothetical protein
VEEGEDITVAAGVVGVAEKATMKAAAISPAESDYAKQT